MRNLSTALLLTLAVAGGIACAIIASTLLPTVCIDILIALMGVWLAWKYLKPYLTAIPILAVGLPVGGWGQPLNYQMYNTGNEVCTVSGTVGSFGSRICIPPTRIGGNCLGVRYPQVCRVQQGALICEAEYTGLDPECPTAKPTGINK